MTARFLRLALAALLVTSLATTASATAGLTGTTAASVDPIAAADLLLADALQDGVSRAGVASVDTSWHMGASGGQFADTAAPVSPEFVDPHAHAVRKEPTEELGSRILTRALVVQGADGERVAVVANDLYLPNDLLNRRVGQLLQLHDAEVTAGLKDGPLVGLTDEQVAVTVSHNHNSAFYSSPSWGVWIFQDVFDIRFFDYMAERMAQAVIEATAALRPVRMGAVTIPFNEIQAHTYGPKVGYDGTPAGQPYSHTTGQLSVVRFDDITDPAHPDPYAAWVILGLHPEWTWGYDVFNGDVTHAAMRVIDRELGVTSVMSQRETGSSGPEKALRVHDAAERREFQDNGFAGLDHAARLWADRVTMAFDALDARTPVVGFDPVAQPLHLPADAIEPIAMVPLTTGFDVASASQRFAPPGSRPVPGISNCNTDQLFHGNVQAPVLGFPDCENGGLDEHTRPIADTLGLPAVYDQLKAAGVPIPDSYTATTLGGVEETAAVHVMAMRIGDLGVTFCPCEQFTDTALNVQTRLDDIADNVWIGWDWEALGTPDGHPDPGRDWCVPTPGAEGMTTCANPQDPTADLAPVPTAMVERMRAQIRNDADGWEADVASVFGESEAVDPAAIFGNFTHDEVDPSEGYPMVVSVGMANDYFGYVPNYREMRAHDHYRKALNGLGLHGADFLANRMVALGHQLNGGPVVQLSPQDLAYQAESGRALALSTTLGTIADAHERAYAASLPADGGTPSIVAQPEDIQRFDAAHVSWVGGSNYTDMPLVTVQRQAADGSWTTVGDMNGEVQMRLDFPTPADLPAVEAGTFEWVWTAQYEAFVHGGGSPRLGYDTTIPLPEVDGTRVTATPTGTYRFTVTGDRRTGPGDAVEPYALTSEPFTVSPWTGITADTVADGEDVVVTVGPTTVVGYDDGGAGTTTYTFGPIDYPNSYDSPMDYVQLTDVDGRDTSAADGRVRFTYRSGTADDQFYCPFCSFRLWADTGVAEAVSVTVTTIDGTVRTVPATRTADGQWRAEGVLADGATARVAAGGVTDAWGNTNGAPSIPVGG